MDGKYVKLRGGRRGVLLIALGLTDHGVRAVLDVVLTGEEDVVSYWDLPVRLWRYNLTLVVAEGVKAVEEAISRSGIQVARQTCPVHLKRSRRVRDALDSSPCPPGALPSSPTSLPPGSSGPSLGPTTRPALQLPPGEFGKCHSPWRIARAIALKQPLHLLSHSCNITRALISS
ncbi:transposase [Metallosphaera yellowstonensis MK1]|uniref:Transposase n=1 Tax=Metallosphaera yellowstonensis MK1 TaxID=671065 RepID=H2C9T8_9CREN|nr:transposase [Metallosphaera yellowstonensis MK1]